MSEEEKQVAIQTTIAPLDGVDKIVVGFSNEVFSQAIYIPYTSVEEATAVGDAVREGLIQAAQEIARRKRGLVIAREIPDGVKNAANNRRRGR